jgi:uncharacterized protein with von Willebrand factor type A (vWA) domain
MFLRLFHALRAERIPATPREFLDLLGALQAGVADADPHALYTLARTTLVKDERLYDRFDRAFGRYLQDVASIAPTELQAVIPEDWLQATFGRQLSETDKAAVQQLGSLQELLQRFTERLAEQQQRHQGGNRWIGTGGTSPFGNSGHHPGGLRVGGSSIGQTAAKVWEQRRYRELDGDAELSPRNLKLALRRLRKFARSGSTEEFDLDATIAATAREGGLLDVRMRPQRHNAVSVILLLDIGGSMDAHVRAAEALFGAARSQFKRLEHFYFHNCIYEQLWRDARCDRAGQLSTWDLLQRYRSDHRVIVVGDAAMHPYEISQPGGAIDRWNAESGASWLQRISTHFPQLVWLNPLPRQQWDWTTSIGMVRQLLDQRMFPLTADGIAAAMRHLAR